MENIFEYYKTAKHFSGGVEQSICSCPFDKDVLETCHAIGRELASCDYFYDMGNFFHFFFFCFLALKSFFYLDAIKNKILKMIRGDNSKNWSCQVIQCLRYLLACKHLMNFIGKNLMQFNLAIEDVNEMYEPSWSAKWGFWTTKLGSPSNQPDTKINVISPYLENMPDKYTLGVLFSVPTRSEQIKNTAFEFCFEIGELVFNLSNIDNTWDIYPIRGLEKSIDVVVFYNNKPPEIIQDPRPIACETNILGLAILLQGTRIKNHNLKMTTIAKAINSKPPGSIICYINDVCTSVFGHYGYRVRGAPFQSVTENIEQDFSFHF